MDQFSNTSNSGLLKNYYDEGKSPLSEALRRKRKKLTDEKFKTELTDEDFKEKQTEET